MKKTILILALVLTVVLSASVLSASDTTRVYDSKQMVVPKYVIKSRADGSQAVYDSRQIVIPKFIIKGDRVYDSRQIVVPKYYLKDGGVRK